MRGKAFYDGIEKWLACLFPAKEKSDSDGLSETESFDANDTKLEKEATH
jgi:hypothetical protein